MLLGPASVPLPLWFGASAKSSEKWFCEIVGDPCWFLDEFWCVLISFPSIFEDLWCFVGFLGAAGPPVPIVPVAFVFPVFCGGFKETPPKPPYQPLGWSYGIGHIFLIYFDAAKRC